MPKVIGTFWVAESMDTYLHGAPSEILLGHSGECITLLSRGVS